MARTNPEDEPVLPEQFTGMTSHICEILRRIL
jgi:hypothetical protein